MEKKIEPEIDNTMFRVENTGRDRKKEKKLLYYNSRSSKK